MKYFADAKCEILGYASGEIEACGFGEMKSTHRRSDFTRRRRISHREAIFHPPVRVDFVEKRTAKAVRFSWQGHKDARGIAAGRRCLIFRYAKNRRALADPHTQKKKPPMAVFLLAGAQGLEPWTRGFGDRCSTN